MNSSGRPGLQRLTPALLCGVMLGAPGIEAARQMETLGRGVVAVRSAEDRVWMSWRLLASDPVDVAFNVYRVSGEGQPTRLNPEPLSQTTWWMDAADGSDKTLRYSVRPVIEGTEDSGGSDFVLPAGAPVRPYLVIPLQTQAGHTPNDAAAGDLDGDGEYELVLKQEERPRDNSRAGTTGRTQLEAYRLDGAFLWRIDLGPNIREGAHYTPFIVFDLDGDGRAEVACRTADGTVDGTGRVLGDPRMNHRNERGYVLRGPEFVTIFDGRTGRALASVDYVPARGRVSDWGDDYGNRVDRFLACVAYLDGQRPSLVMCRGYYTRTVLAAWDWREGQLTRRWVFDSDDGTTGNAAYRGQGNHNLSVGDVDGDGRDEIVYGACCIDDDGNGLYSTELGHGDAMHLADIDPARPGLEVFGIHEKVRHAHGANLRDAATGEILWSLPSPDVGRGLALDIDPRHAGFECWASGAGLEGLFNARGVRISETKPRSCNMGVWWDGDPLRELLDGTRIEKWDWEAGFTVRLLTAEGCASNNGSKANPALCADLLGDWREEVVWRSADNRELRIYVTTIPTEVRRVTLMQDDQYRLGVAWQNVGYNQPAHLGLFR